MTAEKFDRFQLWTLGRFAFARAGRVFDIRPAKLKAMLAYLALAPGGAASRGTLASLLWDSADPDNARTSLRQALATLKAGMGEDFAQIVSADASHVRFDVTACDVDALQLANGQLILDEVLQGGAPSFAFLAGIDPRADAAEEWLTAQRSQFSTLLLARIEAAIQQAGDSGDGEAVLALGANALVLDPLHEGVHAAIIAAYAQQGRRGLAKAHSERTTRLFMTELGVKPDFVQSVTKRAGTVVSGRTDDRQAITVGAFVGASADAPALAEAILGHLSRSLWLRVFSSRQQAAAGMGLRLDGALGAELLLRVTQPADGAIVWTDAIAESGPALAECAAARIEAAVLAAESHRCRGDLSAQAAGRWERLMHARSLFWRTSQRNNQSAAMVLDRLIEEDPGDARALALQAFTHLARAWSGWTNETESACAEGLRLARRAARAEPDRGWPLFTLAAAETTCLPLEQAERTMRRAIALAPALAAAYGELGRILACRGDRVGAEAACDRAAAMAPSDPHASLWALSRAMAAFAHGDYAAARTSVIAAAAVRGEWFQNELLHAACALRLGEEVDARVRLGLALKKAPGYSLAALRVGYPFAAGQVLDDFVDALRTLGWNA